MDALAARFALAFALVRDDDEPGDPYALLGVHRVTVAGCGDISSIWVMPYRRYRWWRVRGQRIYARNRAEAIRKSQRQQEET